MDTTVIATGRQLLLQEPLNDTKFKQVIRHEFPQEWKVKNFTDGFTSKLRNGCKQLSQLIAWIWLSDKITSDQIEETEEKELKKAFDAILKYQAFNNNIDGSDAIAYLLQGDNTSIKKEVYKGNIPENLTLPKIYNDLTGSSAEYVFDSEHLKHFYTEVSVDILDGGVSYDFFGTQNRSKKPKFIVVVPYPIKPDLNEFTVSPDELKEWAQDASNYTPPNSNPFIPVNGST